MFFEKLRTEKTKLNLGKPRARVQNVNALHQTSVINVRHDETGKRKTCTLCFLIKSSESRIFFLIINSRAFSALSQMKILNRGCSG